MLSKLGRSLRISEEVRAAVAAGSAVVALESTIFTSGMPRPTNIETALEVERIVRARGVVPATVGLLGGRLVVGLSQSEVAALGEDASAVKCSTRDLPTAMARRMNGGTTVSATLVAAGLAGVPLFVTGGVGGVHRQGEASMDVSADLAQLGRTPVMTVCAGVKAFLDVGRTLEALETHGVGVATLLLGDRGENGAAGAVAAAEADFPAFYTPSSGHKSPCTLRSIAECARVLGHVRALAGAGFLLAVPIPDEFRQIGDAVNAAIGEALAEAERLGVRGKAVTPFLLERVNRLTQGEGLRANVALIKQNADVGASIAKEFSEQAAASGGIDKEVRSSERANRSSTGVQRSGSPDGQAAAVGPGPKRPVIIGGCNLDLTARLVEPDTGGFPAERTHPGRLAITCGGVGRNVADALARCGHRPVFLSALGRDHAAEMHTQICPHLDWSAVRRPPPTLAHEQGAGGQRSAAYALALRFDGSLLFGVADMSAHGAITPGYLDANEAEFASAGLVCCDGNCPTETVLHARLLARRHGAEFWFEPTDVEKAAKIFQGKTAAAKREFPLCDWATPNAHELIVMHRLAGCGDQDAPTDADALDLRQALAMCRRLIAAGLAASLAVKLGPRGLLLVPGSADARWGGQRPLHCTAAPCQQVVSVSGAGDSLVGGLLAARLSGRDLPEAAIFASLCARASLQGFEAVSPRLLDVANCETLRRDVTVTRLD